MDEIQLLSNVGSLILISGAFLGARGFFNENDFDIAERATLQFYNYEHFNSMLFQKYSEIFGFFLIIFGSLIQFISGLIESNESYYFAKCSTLIILLISTILFNVFCMKIIDKIIKWKAEKVHINAWIESYLHCKENLLNDPNAKKEMDKAVSEIDKLLKEKFKKYSETNPDKIVNYAKKSFNL